MTYKPGTPLPTDRPSISQGDLKTNFGQLNTIFKANHFEYDWATVADRGKHRFVTFVKQAADPVITGTDWATFVKNTTFGAVSGPFIRNSTKVWNTPVVIEIADLTTGLLPGWFDLFNFAAAPAQPKMMGIIFIVDSGTPKRTINSNFSWDGTTVSIPTNLTAGLSDVVNFRASASGAVLSSGDEMINLRSKPGSPSILQVYTRIQIISVRTRILGVLI